VNAINVARDVLKEAFASKFMIGLFAIIGVFLLLLIFSLDLEVVDGALAGSRLFGRAAGTSIVPVDVFLRPAFQALAWVTFYFGLLFGIVATADVAPRFLQPGRVELLLALPVRRAELVVGIYLGVAAICAIATVVAVGGVSLVLFFKAEMVTVAPVAGAAMATIGFLAIYAVMLVVGAVFRSAALSAGSGLAIYILGIAVSEKNTLLMWTTNKAVRTVLDLLTTPVPNLRALADVGAGAGAGEPVAVAAARPLIGSALAFAAFGVVVACAIVQSKDY
jgi:ABC-type transport system involved in multi-copper enzyme maturation permease subunit